MKEFEKVNAYYKTNGRYNITYNPYPGCVKPFALWDSHTNKPGKPKAAIKRFRTNRELMEYLNEH